VEVESGEEGRGGLRRRLHEGPGEAQDLPGPVGLGFVARRRFVHCAPSWGSGPVGASIVCETVGDDSSLGTPADAAKREPEGGW
jgi:hypothetical protein